MKFNIRQYIFPSEANNFKAKIIQSSALLFYITVFVVIQVGFNIVNFIKPGVLGYATDISIDSLLSSTNQKRAENGLNPLILNGQLSAACGLKANDMFSADYWAHNSPVGKTPWDFILAAGYHYIYAGENLAKDFADSSGVINAWMASPTHRDNIVNPKYQEIGFAVVNGKLNGMETTLVVQMFGTQAVQAQAPAPEVVLAPIEKPEILEIKEEEIASETPVLEKTTVEKSQPPEILVANLKNKSESVRPKINIFRLTKEFSLGLVFILIIVLILDTYVAFKEKYDRISGDAVAHIGFLVILIVAVLITSVGMII